MTLSNIPYIGFLSDYVYYYRYSVYVNDDLIEDDGSCSFTLEDSYLYE